MDHGHMNHNHSAEHPSNGSHAPSGGESGHNHDHTGMDHGGMDHGGMNHGGMNHGGMDHDMGNMMQWNWDTNNTNVVFSSWKVNSPGKFAATLLGVFALALVFEALMAARAALEVRMTNAAAKSSQAISTNNSGHSTPATSPVSVSQDQLLPRNNKFLQGDRIKRRPALLRTLLYMSTHLMGIFMMLVFMTYNGYIIFVAVAGAGIGFYFFRKTPTTLGLDKSCCD